MGNTQGGAGSSQSFAAEAPISSELGDVKMLSGHLLVLRKNAMKWDAAYFVLTASTLFMYRELKAYECGTVEMELPLAGSFVHIEKGLFKPPFFAESRERCMRIHAQVCLHVRPARAPRTARNTRSASVRAILTPLCRARCCISQQTTSRALLCG